MQLQRLAETSPCPVQEHTLVRLAEVERFTHFRGRPLLDVAEGHDCGLHRRQQLDSRAHEGNRFIGGEAGLGLLIPARRYRLPRARGWIERGGKQSLRIDIAVVLATAPE